MGQWWAAAAKMGDILPTTAPPPHSPLTKEEIAVSLMDYAPRGALYNCCHPPSLRLHPPGSNYAISIRCGEGIYLRNGKGE